MKFTVLTTNETFPYDVTQLPNTNTFLIHGLIQNLLNAYVSKVLLAAICEVLFLLYYKLYVCKSCARA
jgi:hypothetical protein